jgi:surface protein
MYSGDNIFISQSTRESNTYKIERRDLLVMPTISLPTNYVIETIKPSSVDDKTYVLDSQGSFAIGQVSAVYIDGKKQDEVAYSYAFGDTEEHTVTIVMGENFTIAYCMFYGCRSITSLDLSHLDTSNVTNMGNMFSGLDLTSLDVSHLNTSKVVFMESMFSKCSSITSLDLSHFDTSKVEDKYGFYAMRGMFYKCSSLVEIKMTGDIKDDINIDNMFYNVPTSGTFYYPASKKAQYARFFNGTRISEWKQVDTKTGEEIIKDAGSTDTDGDNGETDATSDSN